MTLYEMFSLIKFITNKDFSGNIITPVRFNELIKVVSIDLFRNKYGLPEEYQPGRPVPNEYADITLKNTDDLKAFKMPLISTPVTAGVLPFPADYAHRDTISYNYTKTINTVATSLPRPVEILREAEFSSRNGNYTKRPTTQNPIAVVRSSGIHIRPISITLVDFHYYRFPVEPVFAYTLGDGFVTYDAVNSTEVEFPVDEHLTLVAMMLKYIGINLREGELVQVANQQLQTGQ
ncbi:MAG: hypothetical protein JJE45_00025 [Prolixibacteraceae bacterium]|nr:hypothetical protein [Prolixibacteraceae bacterium]